LGHVTRRTVSEMTYNVSNGTLNSTIVIPATVICGLLNCHCQWPWSTFKVISAILSEDDCSLILWSLIESPGDVMKDDTADDPEW